MLPRGVLAVSGCGAIHGVGGAASSRRRASAKTSAII
jgi:hypothetical protein